MRYFNGIFVGYRKDMRLWLHPRCGFASVTRSIIGRPTAIIVSSQSPVDEIIHTSEADNSSRIQTEPFGGAAAVENFGKRPGVNVVAG